MHLSVTMGVILPSQIGQLLSMKLIHQLLPFACYDSAFFGLPVVLFPSRLPYDRARSRGLKGLPVTPVLLNPVISGQGDWHFVWCILFFIHVGLQEAPYWLPCSL